MNKQTSIGTFSFILLVSLISVLSVKSNEMIQFSYAIISHNETAFVTNMELMKGHLEQAIVNKEKGNTSLAEQHITHPIEEIFFMIDDMLSNKNIELNNSLSQSLSDTISIVNSSTLQEFIEQIEDDNYKLIDQSINEVIPDRDDKFTLAVIGKIMNTAKEEYNEGVINEKVENILEYQDSLGFVSRAIDLYDDMDIESSAENINGSSSNIGEELNTLQEMMTNQTDASYVVEKILDMTDQISSITGVPFNELTSTGAS